MGGGWGVVCGSWKCRVGGEQKNRSGTLTWAMWPRAPQPTGRVNKVEERASIKGVERFC